MTTYACIYCNKPFERIKDVFAPIWKTFFCSQKCRDDWSRDLDIAKMENIGKPLREFRFPARRAEGKP